MIRWTGLLSQLLVRLGEVREKLLLVTLRFRVSGLGYRGTSLIRPPPP